jgi:hypothetical protein
MTKRDWEAAYIVYRLLACVFTEGADALTRFVAGATEIDKQLSHPEGAALTEQQERDADDAEKQRRDLARKVRQFNGGRGA